MTRPGLLAAALTVAVAVTSSPLASSAAPGSTSSRLGPTTVLREPPLSDEGGATSAEGTLAAVATAFAPGTASQRRQRPTGGRDLTILLRDLRLQLDELAPSDRSVAERYLARPTGGGVPIGAAYPPGSNATSDCRRTPEQVRHVCVHWAPGSAADRPALTDSDADRVPDYVELMRRTFQKVWKRVVTQGDYRRPRSDRLSRNHGPDGKLDVYVSGLPAGLYGYCTSDDPSGNYAVSAYCVLDNDYAGFPINTPTENLRVTAAHEFFHAVQYAYDSSEDTWLLEGTAAWMEDEIYDRVNDSRQYLSQSPLANPQIPLDYYNFSSGDYYGPYGNWVFWRYLTERFHKQGGTGLPTIMRSVISRTAGDTARQRGTYSTKALARALTSRGKKLSTVFAGFTVANRQPRRVYEEGRAYRPAPIAYEDTVGRRRNRLVASVRHLSSATARLRPAAALTARGWRLRVKIDSPPAKRGHAVALRVLKVSGRTVVRLVDLDRDGVGSRTVPFRRGRVQAVEVSVVNASIRYRCNQGTVFACGGVPKGEPARTRITLKAIR